MNVNIQYNKIKFDIMNVNIQYNKLKFDIMNVNIQCNNIYAVKEVLNDNQDTLNATITYEAVNVNPQTSYYCFV